MDGLLSLPNEILIRIFFNLPTIQDVFSVATACSHLRRVLGDGGNYFRILREVAGIPKSFADDLKVPTPATGLAVVGPGEFLVCDGSNQAIHVVVDYSPFEESDLSGLALLDMLSLRKLKPDADYKSATLAFCKQFLAIDRRRISLSLPVEDVVGAAARLQLKILEKNDQPDEKRTDLFAQATIVALALDILAMVQLAGMVSHLRMMGKTDYVYEAARVRFDHLNRRLLSPKVEIRKLPLDQAPKPLLDDRGNEITLGSTLHRLCTLMQGMFSAQHWEDAVPMLYALCILRVAINEVDVHWSTRVGPLEKLAPQRETPMRRVWVDLCRLYFIYTRGTYHPLRYANLGCHMQKFWEEFPDPYLQTHFLRLHELLVQRFEKQQPWASSFKVEEMQGLREFPFLVYKVLSLTVPQVSQPYFHGPTPRVDI